MPKAVPIKVRLKGLVEGLVAKNSCSYRGPVFDSHHPHGSSQSSTTLVPGSPMPSDFKGCQRGMWCTYVHARKTSIYVFQI